MIFAAADLHLRRGPLRHDRARPVPVLHRRHLGHPAPTRSAIDELTGGGGAHRHQRCIVLLRAFSSGAVALTGVEAIADGVPAFQKPESRERGPHADRRWRSSSARPSSGWRCSSNRLQPTASEDETLLSILGSAVFGQGTVLYYVLQFSTFAILILAANTAYADFPRLSSIIARDGFLPHQFKNRGDRLVFSNGIVVLAVHGRRSSSSPSAAMTTALIPLYAVGVFTGFTLTQAGMVRYQRRAASPGLAAAHGRQPASARSPPASCSSSSSSRSSPIGAWLPAVVIPAIVVLFKAIGRHYAGVREEISVDRRLAAPAPHPHRRRARRQRQQGDAAGHRVRPLAGARPAPRGQRRHRRRGGERAGRAVGEARHPGRAPHPLLAVPEPDPAGAALPRRARRRGPATTSSPSSSPSSWSTAGTCRCSTTRPRWPSRPGCSSGPNTVVTSVPIHIGEPATELTTRTRRRRPRCCRPPCTRPQADPRRQARSPRRTSTTSGCARSSPCRSSPPTPSPRPPTRPTRSWSCSSSRPSIGAEAWQYLVPIAIIVCVLLTIVVAQLPPDDLRLPERRRQLHRQPGEPGHDPVAGRRLVAARRLHPDGRGVGGRRRRWPSGPRPGSTSGGRCPSACSASS